jgi:hypothetical protein
MCCEGTVFTPMRQRPVTPAVTLTFQFSRPLNFNSVGVGLNVKNLRRYWLIQEQPMKELDSQHLVDRGGVVALPARVPVDDGLESRPLQIWP